MSTRKPFPVSLRQAFIAGVLTIIPVIVVWVVMDFVFSFLFTVGSPLGQALVSAVAENAPEMAPLLTSTVFEWFIAVVLAVLLICSIGFAASRVIGMRLIALGEAVIARIPFVQTIYSASKKLVGALKQQPGSGARAVLVDFPAPGMKAIGFVMRTYTDAGTGEETAMVYVPTAFNPTAGFLQIVPVARITNVDLTTDQAMALVVSGGAISPDALTTRPPVP